MALTIKNLSKTFRVGSQLIPILDTINLSIEDGEFITIVGHSGCGKSTLLKIISGLVDYEVGTVSLDDTLITSPGPERGMVFQDHRLLPWLNVEENITLGMSKMDPAKRSKILQEHIQLVRLEGFEKAYPHQLSGGMAQRAAIARGLVNAPRILLLDEPFGALDALTRIKMQQEILNIWGQEKSTMIMVTHDIDEAIYLGSRIVVMSSRPGTICDIIDVPSTTSRDRSSSEFSKIKRKIYEHFFRDESVGIEYYI